MVVDAPQPIANRTGEREYEATLPGAREAIDSPSIRAVGGEGGQWGWRPGAGCGPGSEDRRGDVPRAGLEAVCIGAVAAESPASRLVAAGHDAGDGGQLVVGVARPRKPDVLQLL